jgi:transposase
VRDATVWRRALGVDRATVIDKVAFEEEGTEDVVIVRVRQHRSRKLRCGKCGKVAGRYDRGEGHRRWRAHDIGLLRCYLEGEAPRVRCRAHGVVVAQVPWARHDARHTRAFDDQVAWLVTHTAKSTLVTLLRISWVTVGAIAARVVADGRAARDPFDGLVRIGIDEISYRRGQKNLTVVVDHDSGRLVWAAPGRDKATLAQFFDLLGDERAGRITLVSADAAEWIATVVAERCPNATLCADPFHMVAWATSAVDEVRRQVWRDAKRMGAPSLIARIKGCRYALLKNPENLTERQQAGLARVAVVNKSLYRAYLLKEQFRLVFRLRGNAAIAALDSRCQWARRCRIEPFVELYHRIKKHRDSIVATLTHGLSNGLVESTNTKLRLLTRMAYGFRSTDNLIALCMLDRGGYCPPLPGRQAQK